MNNQQIKEWIDDLEDAALGYVSGYPDPLRLNAAAASIGLRALLKTHAIAPREPTDEMLEAASRHHECVQGDSSYCNSEIPESDCADIYKAMIEASENTHELSQSESN